MHVKPVGVSTHCPEFKHGWFPHEVSVDSHVGPANINGSIFNWQTNPMPRNISTVAIHNSFTCMFYCIFLLFATKETKHGVTIPCKWSFVL